MCRSYIFAIHFLFYWFGLMHGTVVSSFKIYILICLSPTSYWCVTHNITSIFLFVRIEAETHRCYAIRQSNCNKCHGIEGRLDKTVIEIWNFQGINPTHLAIYNGNGRISLINANISHRKVNRLLNHLTQANRIIRIKYSFLSSLLHKNRTSFNTVEKTAFTLRILFSLFNNRNIHMLSECLHYIKITVSLLATPHISDYRRGFDAIAKEITPESYSRFVQWSFCLSSLNSREIYLH